IEYGGARYPQAVDVSPLRRVNLALKHLIHGAGDKSFNKKKTIAQALAEEIILAYENNGESFAAKKRNESEKQADSAR
ncbi:MAG: 30S ribosomal protein S7, partial [Patescibacteria group bacterium]